MRRAKLFLAIAATALLSSCATETVQQERMVIAPRMLSFSATDSIKSVSITHTCTCPFTWWSAEPADASWLVVPASMQGDHSSVPISVDRTKMTSDSVHAFVRITSNAYGIDSIEVSARR